MSNKEEYLTNIISALNKFYSKDSKLLDLKTNEMTLTFRIAKYLSDDLEHGDYVVDCEYHGMFKNGMLGRKQTVDLYGKKQNIRPDIIFHIRTDKNHFDKNILAIEIKKKSPKHDIKKVKNIMTSLNYSFGFCISNFGKKYVTITQVFIDQNPIKHRYKIRNKDKIIHLEE